MVEHDPRLPQGTIKVLSRTLFVGGVTCSEAALRDIFSAFGVVQTCIVNVDKRHAFVKMVTRKDAQKARDGMERYKSADMQLRTRWGVGFGPRDCSDYGSGISIVPIARLTDADVKWMLSAEYGGSGGKPIETGMVVEEPDIEIGAGVSSKGEFVQAHQYLHRFIQIVKDQILIFRNPYPAHLQHSIASTLATSLSSFTPKIADSILTDPLHSYLSAYADRPGGLSRP
ncbi:MAG: hypothetical protein Q9174_007517 [Haloplaca sp. 1 TL-2023]